MPRFNCHTTGAAALFDRRHLNPHIARQAIATTLGEAREVHDVLGGILTAIKMDANRILERAKASDLAEIANDLITSVQEGIDVVREVSESLHPAALDHLGLDAAIRNHLDRFCPRHGLSSELSLNRSLPLLTSVQKLAAYRIFQEALTNVVRHANATRVVVRLISGDRKLELFVEDDGVGVDPPSRRAGAMGIVGMRERARDVGGEFLVLPRTPRGTCIKLSFPLGSGEQDK
ncbi:histidine kinase [Burkholderia sp. H160]|nr:histidine kinase [Burkholderia sp. H160]